MISDVFPTKTQTIYSLITLCTIVFRLNDHGCQKSRYLIPRTGVLHKKWKQILPLCSPKKTSLNFLSGLPKSEAIFVVFSALYPLWNYTTVYELESSKNSWNCCYSVISATLMEFRGKQTAHAPPYILRCAFFLCPKMKSTGKFSKHFPPKESKNWPQCCLIMPISKHITGRQFTAVWYNIQPG